MKKRTTLWVVALVLLLALVLTSCGGGQAGGGGGQAGGGGGQGGGGGGSQTSAGKKTTTAHAHKKSPTAGKKAPTGGGVIKTVTIKESEFKLSPSRVTLSKPGTYSFKAEDDGSIQHSLEIEGKGVKSAGGQVGEVKLRQALNPGQSGVLTVTFQKPGTYVMYCPVDDHEQLGMKGEVVVKKHCRTRLLR
jgi:uncharacterized cupredoxin-like copper-binding protein